MGLSTGLLSSFHERLRAERERLGFSRDALAEVLGVRDVTLWRWEGGQNYPSVDHLFGLIDAGFNLGFLMTGETQILAPIDDDQNWGKAVQSVANALAAHDLKPSPALQWKMIRLLYTKAVTENAVQKNLASVLEKAAQLPY